MKPTAFLMTGDGTVEKHHEGIKNKKQRLVLLYSSTASLPSAALLLSFFHFFATGIQYTVSSPTYTHVLSRERETERRDAKREGR